MSEYRFKKGNTIGISTRFKNGHKPLPETIDAIRKSHLGKIPWNKGKTNCYSLETRKRISLAQTGKKQSLSTCLKRSISLSGDKSPNWKGGTSRREYDIFTWKRLRTKIYKRDNWTCQICLIKCHKKGEIQCHHRIPYRISQDNSFGNLITLCRKCHGKQERIYYNRIELNEN